MSSSTLFAGGRVFARNSDGHLNFYDRNIFIDHQDGTIISIDDADKLPQPDEKTIDSATSEVRNIQGRTVLPGFIDGHMHFLMLGQSLQKLDLDGCKNLDEIRKRISEFARQYPERPRLLCNGWMHSMTDGEAKASMLDDLDPRPIFIDAKDLHSTWCNSAALTEMGVQDMPDPDGGTIERDSQGRPSGLLSEAAALTVVWPHIARVAPMEEKLAALRAAIKTYHATGYTGIVEMAMDENAWEAILQLQKNEGGKLNLRIAAHWLILPGANGEKRLKQVDRAIEMNKQFNMDTSPDLRLVGIKVICDGVIDACTAALTQPYSTNVASPESIWSASMLDPVVQRANDAGLQCALHAIGDLAVKTAIDALEKHGKRHLRNRIEHLELTRPEDARRLGELGITASIQPVHSDPAILRAWPKLLGKERLGRAFAYKNFADHGAELAIGSDSPTAPHAPLQNLYVATTRKSARQPDAGDRPVNEHFKLGVCEAVAAATAGAAFSCFAEHRVGSLEAGKKADFVVVKWERDAEGLLEARVLETWFGGKKVFDAETSAGD